MLRKVLPCSCRKVSTDLTATLPYLAERFPRRTTPNTWNIMDRKLLWKAHIKKPWKQDQCNLIHPLLLDKPQKQAKLWKQSQNIQSSLTAYDDIRMHRLDFGGHIPHTTLPDHPKQCPPDGRRRSLVDQEYITTQVSRHPHCQRKYQTTSWKNL